MSLKRLGLRRTMLMASGILCLLAGPALAWEGPAPGDEQGRAAHSRPRKVAFGESSGYDFIPPFCGAQARGLASERARSAWAWSRRCTGPARRAAPPARLETPRD